ncbi:MAG: hypothetical protein MUC71_10180 [Steroidobacteraceae bacterium]|jgi:hypothetical protein|nr:hypothetical protein [Steroidobacteraceae bacterium]
MNVANVPTVSSVFDAMTAARAGLERGLAQAASAAQAVARGSGDPADLARATVDALTAVRQVEASAKMLDRADRAIGTLLDTRA